jgi:tryptophan halogenase
MKKGIPFWLDSEEVIQPYTSCTALKYGWSWHIPLQDRIGSGYVFDSDYISDDEALAEAEAHYGRKLEPRKFIPFEAGRYENYWVKNCIAFGLSSSFIEPLESTSLFATVAQLQALLKYYDDLDNPRESSIKLFNEQCGKAFDSISDFIYLHYITKRKDSKFWQEFKDKNPIPLTLQEKLELLREGNLRLANIDPRSALFFEPSSWLQVGAGLEIIESLPRVDNLDNINPTIGHYKNAIEYLLLHESHNHRHFLENIKVRK